MTRGTLLTAAALLVSAPLLASSDVMTLPEAIDVALRQNHLLGAADAEVAAADARVQEAGAGRSPRLEFAEVFSWTTNPALVFTNKLGQAAFTPADFGIDTLNEPEPFTNFQTRLDLFQPIWAGGRIDGSRDAANQARDAAAASRERTRQEVVHQVVEAYTGVVVADAQLEVAREALETARAHVRLATDLRDAGVVVESDVLQAQVRESELHSAVARAESEAEVARAALNLAMGRPATTYVAVSHDLDARAERDENVEALLEEALERRPDLRAVGLRIDALESTARVERAARRPEFGLRGSLEANEERYPGASGVNWTVMAAFRFEILDGGRTRARVLRTSEETRSARQQEALLRESVSLDVIRAYHDLRAAHRRAEEAGRAVELGREGLRIVEDRYREGLTTLVELLEAETSLTRSRAREIGARRDVLVTNTELDLAVGRL